MTAPLTIRPYEAGDEHGILAGWNAIFPDQDGQDERGLDYWRWAFEQNNLGRTESIVALVDEGSGPRVVAQYASIPQRAVDQDEEVTIGLVVDGFVLPGYRRLAGPAGLIIALAKKLHECYCAPDPTLVQNGHVLTHGYTTKLYRTAKRNLGSEMVRDMDTLFRELGAESLEMPRDLQVERRTSCCDDADEVWKLVRPEIRFGLIRDKRYLDWRYGSNPLHDYTFLVARDQSTAAPRGIAVYTKGDYGMPGIGILCDWISPASDDDAETALLSAAESLAREDAAPLLIAEFPQFDPRFLRWQRKGFLVGPPSQFLTMNTFKHNVLKLRETWYHTLGDSDLV